MYDRGMVRQGPAPAPSAVPVYRLHIDNKLVEPEADGSAPRRRILRAADGPDLRALVEALNAITHLPGVHGIEHAFRVGAMCMAFHSQLRPDSDDALSYFLMGFLHDCGRTHDGPDPLYGRAAGERMTRLGLPLPAAFLSAIAAHPEPRPPTTLEEVCLFDADRLDLVRFGRKIDPRLVSDHLGPVLEPFVALQRAFVANRHCCWVPCQLRSRAALEVYLQLDQHLEHLQSAVRYHGSVAPGLPALLGASRAFPIAGELLYATKDFYEAYAIAADRRLRQGPAPGPDEEVSVYSLDPGGFDESIYTYRGIEYVSSRELVPLGEARCPIWPELGMFDAYRLAVERDLGGTAARPPPHGPRSGERPRAHADGRERELALERALAEERAEVERLEALLARQRPHLAELEVLRERAEKHLADVRASLSWRVTAPLRAVARLLRGR